MLARFESTCANFARACAMRASEKDRREMTSCRGGCINMRSCRNRCARRAMPSGAAGISTRI
eukprot:15365416-Alexandrium_andersonii.AAC.1